MDEIVLTVIDIETEENYSKSQLGCYISLEDTFVDLITPIRNEINEHTQLHINPESYVDQVSFIVKIMGQISEHVGSVRIPVDFFYSQVIVSDQVGYLEQWLSLFPDEDNNSLFGLTGDEEMAKPRILVSYSTTAHLNMSSPRSPVREGSQLSRRSSNNVEHEEYIRLATELNEAKATNEELTTKIETLQNENALVEAKLAAAIADKEETAAHLTLLLEAQNEASTNSIELEQQKLNNEELYSKMAEMDVTIKSQAEVLEYQEQLLKDAQDQRALAKADHEALQNLADMGKSKILKIEKENAARVDQLYHKLLKLQDILQQKNREMEDKDFKITQLLNQISIQSPEPTEDFSPEVSQIEPSPSAEAFSLYSAEQSQSEAIYSSPHSEEASEAPYSEDQSETPYSEDQSEVMSPQIQSLDLGNAFSPQDSLLSPSNISVEQGFLLKGQKFDMAQSFDVLPTYTRSANSTPVVSEQEINRPLKRKDSVQSTKGSTVDEMLRNYLKRRPSKISFVEKQDGVYKFGTKTIKIVANGDNLLVKCAGSIVFIDEFIRNNETFEVSKKLQQRKNQKAPNLPPRNSAVRHSTTEVMQPRLATRNKTEVLLNTMDLSRKRSPVQKDETKPRQRSRSGNRTPREFSKTNLFAPVLRTKK